MVVGTRDRVRLTAGVRVWLEEFLPRIVLVAAYFLQQALRCLWSLVRFLSMVLLFLLCIERRRRWWWRRFRRGGLWAQVTLLRALEVDKWMAE